MASNLSSYYKEEEGFDCLESEHGFCAYRLDIEKKNCYVGHVYIKEESRKSGKAKDLLDRVEELCVKNKVFTIVGDLYLNPHNYKGYTRKLMVMLFNGFEIVDLNKNCTTIMKKLEVKEI